MRGLVPPAAAAAGPGRCLRTATPGAQHGRRHLGTPPRQAPRAARRRACAAPPLPPHHPTRARGEPRLPPGRTPCACAPLKESLPPLCAHAQFCRRAGRPRRARPTAAPVRMRSTPSPPPRGEALRACAPAPPAPARCAPMRMRPHGVRRMRIRAVSPLPFDPSPVIPCPSPPPPPTGMIPLPPPFPLPVWPLPPGRGRGQAERWWPGGGRSGAVTSDPRARGAWRRRRRTRSGGTEPWSRSGRGCHGYGR